MATPHYLSLRTKWQDIANSSGGKFEKVILGLFQTYFAEHLPHYKIKSHPTEFDQIMLETDRADFPERYLPKAFYENGDIYYNTDVKRFHILEKSKWKDVKMGIVPDHMITNTLTGRSFLIEAKHQNDAGNAHERCAKYATPSMIQILKNKLGVDYHPIAYMFGGPMVEKIKYQLELKMCYSFAGNHLVLLKEGPDMVNQLIHWFDTHVKPSLD
jgi:hypothetical protein